MKRSKKSKSDEWETPPKLFYAIEKLTKCKFKLDVAANYKNSKCSYFLTDAFSLPWRLDDDGSFAGGNDVWCNAPGTMIKQFVDKAVDQWITHNMNIVMLIPVNTLANKSFQLVWEMFREGHVDIFPLFGIRPHFLWKGKKSEYGSRNGYIVVHFKKW